MAGGINSEITRLIKISVRNLKLGRGKHRTQTKRVKYSCARKKKVGRSCLQKTVHVSLIFLVNGTPGLLGNSAHVTDLRIINAKKRRWVRHRNRVFCDLLMINAKKRTRAHMLINAQSPQRMLLPTLYVNTTNLKYYW